MIEQRKEDRFIPRDGAYVVFSPAFTKRGPLLNIGRHGLSCIYYVNNIFRPRIIDRFVNLRVGSFVLTDLPFRIVEDLRVSGETPGSLKSIRQRCIEFDQLTSNQVMQLDYLIENLTNKGRSSLSVEF